MAGQAGAAGGAVLAAGLAPASTTGVAGFMMTGSGAVGAPEGSGTGGLKGSAIAGTGGSTSAYRSTVGAEAVPPGAGAADEAAAADNCVTASVEADTLMVLGGAPAEGPAITL